MIEDKELRGLFRIESAERLQRLDDGLLQLEKTPADQSLLEDLFREAHSLKGASRMLGLAEIQTLAHQLEDALGAARKGEAVIRSDAVAEMYQTLETIRRLVKVAVEEPSVADSVVWSAELNTKSVQPSNTLQAENPIAKSEIRTPQLNAPQSNIPPSSVFRIETIRVEPKKLDALLTQTGELTVTKIRIARRLVEIDELLDYCDEWERAVHTGQANVIEQGLASLQGRLNHLRGDSYEDSTRLSFVAEQIESGVRTLRLLPMSTLFGLFPRMVHDLARDQHKEVELVIEGEDAVADKHVLEEMKDPLMHMLRNSIDHGIEAPEQREQAGKSRTGTVRIKASQNPASIIIEVSDDGRGLDLEEIKRTALKRGMHTEQELLGMSAVQIQSLILLPGFSTSTLITDVSGRGVGLDVVRNNIEHLKGTLQIDTVPGCGLTLLAQLPISLATVRVLIVATSDCRYALPVEHVQFSRKVPLHEMYTMEGRLTVLIDGQAVYMGRLDALLGLEVFPRVRNSQAIVACVILRVGEERFGLIVDEVVDELEVVLKPQSKLLKRVRNVSGATILETGEVCMVLNPSDLLKTLRKEFVASAPVAATDSLPAKKVLLLAEDSITTRTQEKRILEGAGYEVVTAVDGVDAYNQLSTRSFDAVVSDIMMPNMTGLGLTEKIRANKKYAELPIILVTSLASEEDQRRGLEAGANAYISKPSFDQQVLLDCLARLI
ncbi:MAG: hybrid sensor histidine kinase/response regulator [Gallionella sp.]|nr:hybrid sensor histidine kinase/response regulator [Gallionella sp.]